MEHPAREAGITIMDLCFNELSVFPAVSDKFEAAQLMAIFAETARIARQRKIRNIKTDLYTSDIILCPGYSMHDWLFGGDFSKTNRTYRDFLIGMIRPPFIPEEREDAYLSAVYHFEDSENNIKKTECQGLAAAYISNTLSISFQNGLAWSKPELFVLVEEQDRSERRPVQNVFSPDSFNIDTIRCFIAEKLLEELGDGCLRRTNLLPQEKKCHISDDHGKDRMIKFWESLKRSPYVESAMSTDFSPKGTQFIREIEPGGEVGIVLLSKDVPYTLRLKTTGSCYPETRRIAELLEKEFS
jgi:hypothetical protein